VRCCLCLQAKAHVRELQAQIVSATLQQLARDAAELAEDAEVSSSESEDTEAAAGAWSSPEFKDQSG